MDHFTEKENTFYNLFMSKMVYANGPFKNRVTDLSGFEWFSISMPGTS
jgi:hypothetical protein